MIKFRYHPEHIPNPAQVALCLEDAVLPDEVVPVDTRKGEQHSGATTIGPCSGQALHFKHCAPEPKAYAVIRDGFEAQRQSETNGWRADAC